MVVSGLFLPKLGKFALVDVAFDNTVVRVLAIYIFLKVRKLDDGIKKNVYGYIVCGILIVVSVWFTKNLVSDIMSGPEQILLYNIEVTKNQGSKGVISLHYYLEGVDSQGTRYKIEISSDDYSKMASSDTLVIKHYKNTRRLYDFEGREE